MHKSRCPSFLRDSQMTWLQQNFNRAKAVIIAPELVKAGFIFGGSGGRAVVVARDPEERQVAWARVLHDGDGKRGLPGRHFGVGERDARDDG